MADNTKAKTTASKGSFWDQYNNWVMESIVPQLRPYYKNLPHLSSGLKNIITILIKIGYYIGLALSVLAILALPILLLGGIGGIITMVVIVIQLIAYFMSFSAIKSSTHKGWEYLFSLMTLQIVAELAKFVIQVFTGFSTRSMDVAGILIGLLGFAIGAYFMFEVESEFKD